MIKRRFACLKKWRILLMKRLVFVSLFVLAAFYFTGCSSGGGNDSGGGGDSDYILISDAGGLNNIRDNLSGKYRLSDDMDLSVLYDSGWTPIGSYSEAEPFTGVLDGNGHKIEGLYVTGVDSAGLFGYIGEGAEVKNLTIEISSDNIIGTKYAGALAGFVEGAEDNKVIISEVTIAGTGEVRANTSDEDTIYAGGLVGVLFFADLSDCVNGADISSDLQGYAVYSGGIAGVAADSNISGSYNTGNVDATADNIWRANSGGIAGAIANSYITGSHNEGEISAAGGDTYAGGIAAHLSYSEISNSYNTGIVDADGNHVAHFGGIAGYFFRSKISGSYNTGDISAAFTVLSAYTGGIAGEADNSEIANTYNTGGISGTVNPSSGNEPASFAGGIVGRARDDSKIMSSYNRGNISLPTSFSYIDNFAGGIAGSVFWESEIRGNAAINGTIVADTTGTTEIGRVLGLIDDYLGANTVTNNFANSGMTLNSSAVSDSAENGTGVALTDFQSRDTYETGMGWLFGNDDENPWVWEAFEDYPYPTLRWQTEAP
jgi:hypothetical protein